MFGQPVHEVMSAPVIACEPALALPAAYQQLLDHDISSMAVVASGRLVGVVSRADLISLGVRNRMEVAASFSLPDEPVETAMTKPAIVVGDSVAVRVAARAMVEHGIHRVYVTRDSALAGVLSTRDIMDVVGATRLERPISELATTSVHSIDVAAPVRVAIERLEATGVTGLIVTEHDHVVGMFSRREALEAWGLDLSAPVEEAMDEAVICLQETSSAHRAARRARKMGVRRIVCVRHREMSGVISGMDFARFAAQSSD